MTDRSRIPRWTAAARARLAAAAERREGGFVLEGRKLVLDALGRKDLVVREVWVGDDVDPDVAQSISAAALARDLDAGIAPSHEIDRTSDVVTPQGVLALADDPAVDAQALIARGEGPLVLLDGVQDPGNVGAILRCAAAFGFRGALVGRGSADPVGAKALRASAGAALAMPFARAPVERLVELVRAGGRELWLLDADGTPLWSTDRAPPTLVLAVGSEGRGASEALRVAASRRLSIPIAPSIESLNAAVAFGVAAAHVGRLVVPVVLAPDRAPASGRRR